MTDLLETVTEKPERKQYDFLNMYVRERFGLSDDWQWFKWERLGDPSKPSKFVVVTGAVCTEVYTKGKRKGELDWRKRDKSTEVPATVKTDEYDAWLLEWEKRSGECHKCHGNGDEWTGWSATNGNRYRPCSRCGATGKAPRCEAA